MNKSQQLPIRNYSEFLTTELRGGQTEVEIIGQTFEEPLDPKTDPPIYSLTAIVDTKTKQGLGYALYPKEFTYAELEELVKGIKADVITYINDEFKPNI